MIREASDGATPLGMAPPFAALGAVTLDAARDGSREIALPLPTPPDTPPAPAAEPAHLDFGGFPPDGVPPEPPRRRAPRDGGFAAAAAEVAAAAVVAAETAEAVEAAKEAVAVEATVEVVDSLDEDSARAKAADSILSSSPGLFTPKGMVAAPAPTTAIGVLPMAISVSPRRAGAEGARSGAIPVPVQASFVAGPTGMPF